MPHYTVQYLDRRRPADRDAVALAFRVFRDDDYFQFVEAWVSGIALSTQRRSSVGADRFWAWLAREAVDEIAAAVERGEIPLGDPTTAFVVTPSVDAVMRRAEAATIDALREETVIGEFEAS